MKVRASVKRICENCKLVRRHGQAARDLQQSRVTSSARAKRGVSDMPRILGVDMPNDKPTHISLRYLYGIGPTLALRVCEQAHVDPQRRAKELSDDEIGRIADHSRPRIHGRRAAAPPDPSEHRPPQGHRLLSRPAAPQEPAGARPADARPTPAPARGRARPWPARRASRKCAAKQSVVSSPCDPTVNGLRTTATGYRPLDY